MKFPLRHFALATLGLVAVNFASAQIILTGTSYTQNFDSIGSGLPEGWEVYTSATASTLGTTSVFTNTQTLWNSTTGIFRNIASNNGASTDNTAAQNENKNRALGWRPVGVTGTDGSAREGAVTVQFNNTLGYENFQFSVLLFTANDVGTNQNYSVEYRVGDVGSFTSIGTYTTGEPFKSSTISADSITLSALNNQSSAVYFRIRGVSTSGTTNLDTLGIDNFTLTYSSLAAVPEPSTYAAILGGVALVGVMIRRRKKQTTVV